MNKIKKTSKFEVDKDFRTLVTKLENDLKSIAETEERVVAGTDEDPIITNSDKIPIKHFFMDGVYVREMTMFKGSIVIGAIHKHLHMCFLLKGHLTVVSEIGVNEYIAPCFIIAEPGEKRVLYAHENSLWYNTHKNETNTKDVKDIEKRTVAVSYKEYEEYINNKNK